MSTSTLPQTRIARPHWRRQWTYQLGFALLILLLLPASVGWVVQERAAAFDMARFPAPGQQVEVNGQRLHLHVMGESSGGPTVVLEAGLGHTVPSWSWIQPEIARQTTVVAYDRAGLGWSGPATTPRTARQMAQELHAALKSSGIEGPYVLVGHSLGGLLVRMFHELYPDDVVGIVFVDASHPEQYQRYPAYAVAFMRLSLWRMGFDPLLARFGLTRLGESTAGDTLPEWEEGAFEAFAGNVQHLRGVHQEARAWEAILAEVGDATGDLGDIPVIALSASLPDLSVTESFQKMHADLATLSTRGEYRIVPESDHNSLVLEQADAHYVIEAIQDVLNAVR